MKILVTTIMTLASLAYAAGGATPTLTLDELLTANWTISVSHGTPQMSDDDDALSFEFYRTRKYTDEHPKDWEANNPVSYLQRGSARDHYVVDFAIRNAGYPTESKDIYVLDFYVTNNLDKPVQISALTFKVWVMSNTGQFINQNVMSGTGLTIRPEGGTDVDAGLEKGRARVDYSGTKHEGTASYDLAPYDAIVAGSTVIAPGKSLRISYTQNNMGTNPYYYGIENGTITYKIVPEPATGTLSLLALAALAARRRKH